MGFLISQAAFAMLYIVVLRVGFRTFDCTWMDDQMRLDLNPEIVCDWSSGSWLGIFGVGVFIVAVYGLGIPFAIWSQMNSGDLQEVDMLKKYGWMYARYRPGCFYWEFLLMLEKGLLSATTTFLTNQNRFSVAFPLALIVTLLSLVLQLKLLPYAECTLSRPLTGRSVDELVSPPRPNQLLSVCRTYNNIMPCTAERCTLDI